MSRMDPSARATRAGARAGGLLRRLTPRRAADYATRPLRLCARRLLPGRRGLPDFIIIGAQKAGTTSLFRYLCAHPSVAEPLRKEVHYFDVRYRKGMRWYRSHFPPSVRLRSEGGELITGEATANYLFDARAPGRVQETVPDVRLLALLRDPVARAHSHYRHNVRVGRETRPFEQAIDEELAQLAGSSGGAPVRGSEQIPAAGAADPPSTSSARDRHFSYVRKGIYEVQLSRWMRIFGPEQMLVLASRDLFGDPGRTLAEATRFLALEPVDLGSYPVHNPGAELPLEPATENRLRRFFDPHDVRLRESLERWRRGEAGG